MSNKISKSQERRIKIMKDARDCEHPLLVDAIKKRWAVKIRVTPEHSRTVQEICYDNNVYCWSTGDKSDINVFSRFIIIRHNEEDGRLLLSTTDYEPFFKKYSAKEYDFENKRFVENCVCHNCKEPLYDKDGSPTFILREDYKGDTWRICGNEDCEIAFDSNPIKLKVDKPKLTPEMLNGWWKWKKGSSKFYKIGWIDASLNVVVVGLSEGYIPVERLLEDWQPISAEEVIKILEGNNDF